MIFPGTISIDFQSIRYQFAGGAPVTPELVRIAKQKMPVSRTLIGYGMTENTCASCTVWPGAPDDVTIHSVGKPLGKPVTKLQTQ